MAELGGKHLQQDHKLVYDTPVASHNSDQRSGNVATPKTTKKTEGVSDGPNSDEGSNEDDDEDSSAVQGDDLEDEEDNQEASAPSRGLGKGKGKRPAMRVEPASNYVSEEEDNDTMFSEIGLNTNQLLMSNKKRTFSNVSNTSLLFGDDEAEGSFPRRKMARKLSNSSFKPLLKYKENANPGMYGSENAIESDDEDYSGVNLVPDDMENMDDFEQEEESFIIQEELEQKNSFTSYINQYNDARRLSFDSHASENIFTMTAPLTDPYVDGMSLPDNGFGQFFEPEALPSSPNPTTKRKYSDSSTKRVRFDDEVEMSDSSSSSSSDLDSSLYPDLFLEQDKLPLSLSQLMETEYEDNGDYDSPGSELSFWDFAHEERRPARPTAQIIQRQNAPDVDELSDPGSSGYESMLVFFSYIMLLITNIMSQLTWAIPLTSTNLTWIRMPIPKHRYKRNLSCTVHPLHQVRRCPARNHLIDLLSPSDVLSPQPVVFSYTMTATKQLR
jgi:hypothetical protein